MPTEAERWRFLSDHLLTLHTDRHNYLVHWRRTGEYLLFLGPHGPIVLATQKRYTAFLHLHTFYTTSPSLTLVPKCYSFAHRRAHGHRI